MAEIALDYEHLSDVELAMHVVRRDPHAVRVITGRNNQRLYRAAWSVLRNRAEAEEAVQDAYLKAFFAMASFAGASSLSTWLTRIVINQASERKRTAERRERLLQDRSVIDIDDYRESFMAGSEMPQSPEAETMRRQIAKLLERAIANLPETFPEPWLGDNHKSGNFQPNHPSNTRAPVEPNGAAIARFLTQWQNDLGG